VKGGVRQEVKNFVIQTVIILDPTSLTQYVFLQTLTQSPCETGSSKNYLKNHVDSFETG